MTAAANHRKTPYRLLLSLFTLLTGRRSGSVSRASDPACALVRSQDLPVAEGVHDLRNVLTILSACAERISERAPRGVADDELADLREYVSRALLISTELLLSAGSPAERSAVDLNDVVTPTIATLSRCLGRRLRLRLRLAAGPLTVIAYPSELEKILLNLAINAIEAMGHQGLLIVTTSLVVAGSTLQHGNPRIRVARLEVADTGCGMAPEVISGIFEPFYSTKEGAGLGLSSAATTIKKLGGTITVDSAPGRGTSITVDLPCVASEHIPGDDGVITIR
jgi:two-component system cell cycle sensor histidine kinase/response regulator CckA